MPRLSVDVRFKDEYGRGEIKEQRFTDDGKLERLYGKGPLLAYATGLVGEETTLGVAGHADLIKLGAMKPSDAICALIEKAKVLRVTYE